MKYLLLLSLLSITFAACEDDDDGNSEQAQLTIDFAAQFGGQPLAVQAGTYAYPNGAELKVQLFQYYVSDLELLPADGGIPVVLSDIDLIRWESALDGPSVSRTYTVPPGNYRGLRFGLGVSPDVNAKDPSEFAADFVLNETEFWGPVPRYVFAKIEANADLNDDNRFDTGLSYHMGSDNLYTTVNFSVDVRINGVDNPALTLNTDLLNVFTDGSAPFDIRDPNKQAVHGGNQAVARELWERLAANFSLQIQ